MKSILLNTDKAKLMHFQGSAPPKSSDTMMLVRSKLINEYKN